MKKKLILLLIILSIVLLILTYLKNNNNNEKRIYNNKTDIEINVKYPLYKYKKLNKKISTTINYYLKDNIDNYYFLIISYKEYKYKSYISIVLYISYFTGGAHPNYEIKTINYNTKSNNFITIDNLIKEDKNILNKLSNYSRNYFNNNDLFKNKIVNSMMLEGTSPNKENYQRFNLSNDGLIIYFDRYQVAPYYYGDYNIIIPYKYLNLSIWNIIIVW